MNGLQPYLTRVFKAAGTFTTAGVFAITGVFACSQGDAQDRLTQTSAEGHGRAGQPSGPSGADTERAADEVARASGTGGSGSEPGAADSSTRDGVMSPPAASGTNQELASDAVSGAAGDNGNRVIIQDDADKEPAEACRLTKEIGSCDELLLRSYYDSRSRRCERFTFSGCDGNANNFETARDCGLACGGAAPCGCIDDSPECDPFSCELCPAELAMAMGEPCAMRGLDCRQSRAFCTCIGNEAEAATWDCQILVH